MTAPYRFRFTSRAHCIIEGVAAAAAVVIVNVDRRDVMASSGGAGQAVTGDGDGVTYRECGRRRMLYCGVVDAAHCICY